MTVLCGLYVDNQARRASMNKLPSLLYNCLENTYIIEKGLTMSPFLAMILRRD